MNLGFLRSQTVHLIDQKGQSVGIIRSEEAMERAKDLSLDLILVSRKNNPPICRLGDYGKIKYDTNKKQKESNKSHSHELKILTFRPCTQNHDLDILIKKAKEFLNKGHKVKLECKFRKREMRMSAIESRKNIEYICKSLEEDSKKENNIDSFNNIITVTLSPK